MATTLDSMTDSTADTAGSTVRSSRRRWKLWLLLGMSVGVLWMAPHALSLPQVRRQLLQWSLPAIAGQISIESVDADWVKALSVGPVQIESSSGETLLSWESLTTDRSLWQLIAAPDRPGVIHLERPKINLSWPLPGVEWERLVAALPGSEGESRSVVELVVNEADILLTVDESPLRLHPFSGTISIDQTAELPLKLNGTVTLTGDRPGSIAGRIELVHDLDNPLPAQLDLQLEADQFDLESLAALVRQIDPAVHLAGRVNGSTSVLWNDVESTRTTGSVNLRIDGFSLHTPLQHTGEVQFDQLVCRGELERLSDMLQVRDGELRCDAALVECSGKIPLAGSRGLAWEVLEFAEGQVKFESDLARLLECVPGLVVMKDQMRLTAGQLNGRIVSQRDAEGNRQWLANCRMSDLTATHPEKQIVWKDPLEANLSLRLGERGVMIDQLECRSEFLQCRGEGTRDEFTVDLTCDLARLSAELSEFMDLSGMELTGALVGRVGYRLSDGSSDRPSDRFFATSRIEELSIGRDGRVIWNEPDLQFSLVAVGDLAVRRIDSAQARLTDSQFRIDARSTEPMFYDELFRGGRVEIDAAGDLASIDERLRRLDPAWPVRTAGKLSIQADLLRTSDEWRLQTRQALIDGLLVSGDGLRISESQVAVKLDLRLNSKTQAWSVPTLLVSGDAGSLDVTDMLISLDQSQPSLSGRCRVRGDVGRLSQWFDSGNESTTWDGLLVGAIEFRSARKRSYLQGDLRLDHLARTRFVPGTRTTEVQRFDQVQATARLDYDWVQDSLLCETLEITGLPAQLHLQGRVDRLQTDRVARLDGRVDYRWSELLSFLGIDAGTVSVRGKRSESLSLMGPLIWDENGMSDRLQGSATLGWDQAAIGGLQLGALASRWDIDRRLIRSSRIQLPIGTGSIDLEPALMQRGPSWFLLQARPTRLNRIALTQDLCSEWIRFAAPLVADATQIEGELSAEVRELVVPLEQPGAARMQGTLFIHGAEMRAAPLLREYFGLAARLRQVLRGAGASTDDADGVPVDLARLPEQQVVVSMQDGVIQHQGLTAIIQGLEIKTSGAVTVDERMQLVAEVTIPARWVQKQRHLSRLAGQVLRIPITGTLSRPTIDSRAIASLAQQLARGSVESAIEGEVDRQLRKLFDR